MQTLNFVLSGRALSALVDIQAGVVTVLSESTCRRVRFCGFSEYAGGRKYPETFADGRCTSKFNWLWLGLTDSEMDSTGFDAVIEIFQAAAVQTQIDHFTNQ